MGQLNIPLTSEFEKELRAYMKVRHIPTKVGAIRLAVKESLAKSQSQANKTDFSNWVGLAVQVPTKVKPRFRNSDELWK